MRWDNFSLNDDTRDLMLYSFMLLFTKHTIFMFFYAYKSAYVVCTWYKHTFFSLFLLLFFLQHIFFILFAHRNWKNKEQEREREWENEWERDGKWGGGVELSERRRRRKIIRRGITSLSSHIPKALYCKRHYFNSI